MTAFLVRPKVLLALLLLVVVLSAAPSLLEVIRVPATAPGTVRAVGAPVLQGRVVDAVAATPIGAVQISVEATGTGALTRGDGVYELPLPAEWVGRAVTVRADHVGYAGVQATLTVRGGTNQADFLLHEQAPGTVVVAEGGPSEGPPVGPGALLPP